MATPHFAGPARYHPELLGPVLRYLNNQICNLALDITNLTLLRPEGELFVREQVFEFGN